MKARVVQVQADKLEIMRDLSTYEINFSKHLQFRKYMGEVIKTLEGIKVNYNREMEEITKYSSPQRKMSILQQRKSFKCSLALKSLDLLKSGADKSSERSSLETDSSAEIQIPGGYLKDDEILSITDKLKKLVELKKERADLKLQKEDEFRLAKGMPTLKPPTPIKRQTFVRAMKKSTNSISENRPSYSNSLECFQQGHGSYVQTGCVNLVSGKVDLDKLYLRKNISGLNCLVQAEANFNSVTGFVSCSIASKPFKFTIR